MEKSKERRSYTIKSEIRGWETLENSLYVRGGERFFFWLLIALIKLYTQGTLIYPGEATIMYIKFYRGLVMQSISRD